jgi:hypothetical protein
MVAKTQLEGENQEDKTELQKAIETDNLNRVLEVMDSLSTMLGYIPIKKCSCEGKTNHDREILEKFKLRNYIERINCLHYGNESRYSSRRDNDEGVISIVESAKAAKTVSSILSSVTKYGLNSVRHGISGITAAQIFLDSGGISKTVLGTVNHFVYGRGWSEFEGKEQSTDFQCPKGNWGAKLGIPLVVKCVNYEQILRKAHSR